MNKLLIALFATTSLAVACGGTSTGTSSGTQPTATDPNASTSAGTTNADNADVNEASGSAAQTSELEQTLLGPVQSTDPAVAASAVAAAQWWPAGCATRQKDATNPLEVHVHLDNCTGPFGLVKHTGDITLTFSQNADKSLHAEAASSNMTVNGKAVTFAASRDISLPSAGLVDVKGHAAWTRQNAAGETVSHTTTVDTSIDVAKKCRTSNGSATTVVGAREVDATFTSYEVCRKPDGSDACPTGDVSYQLKASGRTVSVAFDGSAEATITGPKGGTAQVALVCTP